MPSREVKVAILGDPSSLQRALRASDQGVTRFGQKMASVSARLRSVGSSMTRSLTLPLVAFGAIGVRELTEGENALAQTRAVIESTGGAARKSVGDILEMSSALSELTSLDDEDIQGVANTLLTFRDIAGRTFNQTTRAALDLSVAMGTDLHSAAIQVGKAVNDPIRGLTALTRVGVTFSQAQRDAIQQMVYFGDTAGAQQVILRELNAEFGGSAEALGETLSGRLRRAQHRFEDLSAEIVADLIPVLEDVVGIIDNLADRFDNLTPKQQQIVSGMILFAAVAGPLSSVLGLLTGALAGVAAALGVTSGIVLAVVVAVAALAIGIYIVITRWETLSGVAQNAINNIVANVPGATAVVGFFRTSLDQALGAARALAGGLVILGGIGLDALLGALRSVVSLIQAAISAVGQLIDRIAAAANAVASLPGRITGSGPSLVGESTLIPRPRSRRPAPSGTVTPITPAVIEQAFRRALREEVQLVKAI